MEKCIFCGSNYTSRPIDDTTMIICSCENCGEYEISTDALQDFKNGLPKENDLAENKHLISGYIYEMYSEKQPNVSILTNNIKDIYAIAKVKSTMEHKINRLLIHIYNNTNHYGSYVYIKKNHTSICYAKNRDEVENLCKALGDLGFAKVSAFGAESMQCKLESNGYKLIEERLQKVSIEKQCFIAMWFNEELLKEALSSIKKAIEYTGFEPFVSINEHHNDDICDGIVANIKKSNFMIADFTGQRQSVYFEAGMALGLGKTVIWTCREDWFNNSACFQKTAKLDGQDVQVQICDEGKVHFDVNHYKFIVWKDSDDLYKKLVDRIEATIK